MCGGDGCAANGREAKAAEVRLAGGTFTVDVIEGSRRGAFHVVVEEAFEHVEVRVGGYIGDYVNFAWFC